MIPCDLLLTLALRPTLLAPSPPCILLLLPCKQNLCCVHLLVKRSDPSTDAGIFLTLKGEVSQSQ